MGPEVLSTNPPSVWTVLIILISTIPTIITSIATLRKTNAAAGKLDIQTDKLVEIHHQVNGNTSELVAKSDYLAYRLSRYENIPSYFRSEPNAGNPEPGSSDSRGSDASGPGSELRRNEEPI